MKKINGLIAAFIAVAILFLPPFSALGQVERHEIPVGASAYRGPADAPITIIEFLDFQ